MYEAQISGKQTAELTLFDLSPATHCADFVKTFNMKIRFNINIRKPFHFPGRSVLQVNLLCKLTFIPVSLRLHHSYLFMFLSLQL